MISPNTTPFMYPRDNLSSGDSTPVGGRVQGGDIAGLIVGIVAAVAAILALFKGWKCWRKKTRNRQVGTNASELAMSIRPNADNIEQQSMQSPNSNVQAIHNTTHYHIQICAHPNDTSSEQQLSQGIDVIEDEDGTPPRSAQGA